MAILAGLICSAAGIKNAHGSVLTAADFDNFNREPQEEKELTVADFMSVLSRKAK